MPWKKESPKSKKEQQRLDTWLKETCKKRPKFLCDENLPANIAERLRASGFNATSAYEEGIQSKPDEFIYSKAFKDQRVLLTQDEDFWDNSKFELKRATPTILLPSSNLERALSLTLRHIAPYFEVFKESKVKILPQETSFIIVGKNAYNGAVEVRQFRFVGNSLEEFYHN